MDMKKLIRVWAEHTSKKGRIEQLGKFRDSMTIFEAVSQIDDDFCPIQYDHSEECDHHCIDMGDYKYLFTEFNGLVIRNPFGIGKNRVI